MLFGNARSDPYPHLTHQSLSSISDLEFDAVFKALRKNVESTQTLLRTRLAACGDMMTQLSEKRSWIEQTAEYGRLRTELKSMVNVVAESAEHRSFVSMTQPAASTAVSDVPEPAVILKKEKRSRRTAKEMRDLRANGLEPPAKKSKIKDERTITSGSTEPDSKADSASQQARQIPR